MWIGLWGGANTLAHAVWKVWKTRSEAEFAKFISKLRVYGISDQDFAGNWLRDMFGDKLFYIVSPSVAGKSIQYLRATWRGISTDNLLFGISPDKELVTKKWLKKNVVTKGPLGKKYPLPRYIMEGDTPTYLYLLPKFF